MRVLSVLEGAGAGAGTGGGARGGAAFDNDVRARMLVSVLASIATVAISNLEGQVLLAAVSFGYALTLRRPVILLWAYAFMALMCLMALGCTQLMRMLMPTLLRDAGAASLLIPFLRMLTMLHVVLPLALGSRLQNMLDALRGLRLPFCLYLPAAVMLRFIPSFVHDVGQVAESLRLRGFEPGMGNFVRHPLLTLRLLCAPLLFRSLRASEDLGVAAELKGLGAVSSHTCSHAKSHNDSHHDSLANSAHDSHDCSRLPSPDSAPLRGHGGRMTPYRATHWGRQDTLLVLLALAALTGAALCQYWLGSSGTGGMR